MGRRPLRLPATPSSPPGSSTGTTRRRCAIRCELFQAPILYPAKYVLAFSENLYGAAVFGFPLLAVGASPVAQLQRPAPRRDVPLGAVGLGAGALRDGRSARVARRPASVYAFLPCKIAQIPHLHIEWGAFLCLVFLFLLPLPRRGDGAATRVLLAVVFAWNALACIQYAFFTGFLVAVVLVWGRIIGGPARKRRIAGALLAMGLAAVACLPFVIPYKKASRALRDAPEHRRDDVLLGTAGLLPVRRRAQSPVGSADGAVSRLRGRLLPGDSCRRARGSAVVPAPAASPRRLASRGRSSRVEAARGATRWTPWSSCCSRRGSWFVEHPTCRSDRCRWATPAACRCS